MFSRTSRLSNCDGRSRPNAIDDDLRFVIMFYVHSFRHFHPLLDRKPEKSPSGHRDSTPISFQTGRNGRTRCVRQFAFARRTTRRIAVRSKRVIACRVRDALHLVPYVQWVDDRANPRSSDNNKYPRERKVLYRIKDFRLIAFLFSTVVFANKLHIERGNYISDVIFWHFLFGTMREMRFKTVILVTCLRNPSEITF